MVPPKEATDNLLVETKHQLLQRRGEDLKKRFKTEDGKNNQRKTIIDRSWVSVPVAALQTTTTAMVAQ